MLTSIKVNSTEQDIALEKVKPKLAEHKRHMMQQHWVQNTRNSRQKG
jgi:hypothetical protein